MKIKKVFRQKGTRSLVAFSDEKNCIKVDFWGHSQGIQLSINNIEFYENDINYEEISISSFIIALKVVKNRINNKLYELKF
ncbi:MAG: hypothetical protein ACOWWH_12750 [Eubacteriaceae bacterium]